MIKRKKFLQCIFDKTPLRVQTLPMALTRARRNAKNTVHFALKVRIRRFS